MKSQSTFTQSLRSCHASKAKSVIFALLFLLNPFVITSCDSISSAIDEETTETTDPTTTPDPVIGENVPDIFKKFTNGAEVYLEGDMVVIQINGVPNHSSPYFATTDQRYEAYNGDNNNFMLNPNRIREQDFTFRIPVNPQEATNKEATPLGAIGVAINGVAIFNQYAGPNQPLTNEIDSFDQYNGHPQQTGVYHYHVEPFYLTDLNGTESIIGFLLDGFPVYGPDENGQAVINGNLDPYHGHLGPTEDYPDGIYHYHITDEDPYINGAGFFGTTGSVSG